ncbi:MULTISPECIES: LCP family protein [Arthrobacter]|uniref:LCP family protein n=2 Tax=Arthrobacter TaxID=1663 RepID=A0ABU9KIV8_9MICC|nr:LCP family protein [Arthrobacter sp. YJM1]MDP5226999.1 LCP family protein [Arthrobacter sp. YJM1]
MKNDRRDSFAASKATDAPASPPRLLAKGASARHPRSVYLRRRVMVLTGLLVTVAVVLAGVFVASTYFGLEGDIRRSNALDGSKGLDQDTNILLMGLDSRLDENGKPLSQEEYDALHAGDSGIGGYNSNVLMLLHIPKDGSTAQIVSIPRDDYVDLPGQPDGMDKGKIKEAYGFAMDQAMKKFTNDPQGRSQDQIYQDARDEGRKEEISTVEQFLNVKVDHFVEVTMAAFLSVAEAVAPIKVCLQHDTSDTFSGADFKAGVQEINAKQAVAFVRQRRDTSGSGYDLTDLDRSRRQQAFITSLATQLKQQGTFTDLGKINGIVGALKDKIAVDQGLNLVDLGMKAKQLGANHARFVTLPILSYGTSDTGESVNLVDQDAVRKMAARVLGGGPVDEPTTAAPPAADGSGSGGQGSGGQGSAGAGTVAAPPQQDPTQQDPAQQQPAAPAPAPSSSAPGGSYNAGDWNTTLSGGGVPCVK